MCEAEDYTRELLRWLKKRDIRIYAEWSKIQADKSLAKLGLE